MWFQFPIGFTNRTRTQAIVLRTQITFAAGGRVDERLLHVELESPRALTVQSVRVERRASQPPPDGQVADAAPATQFTVTYCVFEKGCFRLLVTYNNEHVQNSPFLCKIC